MRSITLQEPFRALFYAPFYAALARGAYAAEGVDVRLLPGDQPSAVADAVLAGKADFGWGGPMRLLLAHDKDPGCPLRLFGAVVMRDPFFLVGRLPNPDFQLGDLGGLRLGTVSEVPTPWWTLQDDIRRTGLDPALVDRVSDADMAANIASVQSGRLDVAQVFEPHASRMEREGSGHVWHVAASRGLTSYTAFYARSDRIEALRAEFGAVLRGLASTLNWVATAPVNEIGATIGGYFPDLDMPLLERCLTRYRELDLWTGTPRFPPEALARLEAAMLSAGAIQRSPGFDGLVAEDLTEEALHIR
jgi:NitT/TauT family transport system substrate-binding protein